MTAHFDNARRALLDHGFTDVTIADETNATTEHEGWLVTFNGEADEETTLRVHHIVADYRPEHWWYTDTDTDQDGNTTIMFAA